MIPTRSQFGTGVASHTNCGAACLSWCQRFTLGIQLSVSYIRTLSKVDPALGLGTLDVVRVMRSLQIPIRLVTFGYASAHVLTPDERTERMQMLKDHCGPETKGAAQILGDYDAFENTDWEVLETFQGDHWIDVADYDPSDDTFIDMDPTRPEGSAPKRIPAAMVERFWLTVRKNTELMRGRAVFVGGEDDMKAVKFVPQYLLLPKGAVVYKAPNGEAFPALTASQVRPVGVFGLTGWRAVQVGVGADLWLGYVPTSTGTLVDAPVALPTDCSDAIRERDQALAAAASANTARDTALTALAEANAKVEPLTTERNEARSIVDGMLDTGLRRDWV